MTEIVFKNFISLLSAGAFQRETTLEPMSKFKWYQLLRVASAYNVLDIVSLEMVRQASKRTSIIPQEVISSIKEETSNKSGALLKEKTYEDFVRGVDKKFSNFFINRRMNKLISNEVRSIDLSVPTLVFMDKLSDCINEFLISGPNFRSVIEVGISLRTKGDKIDFIKINEWIKSLGMNRMAGIIGSYLIEIFGFTLDEIPFINRVDSGLYKKTYKLLKNSRNNFKVDDTSEIESVKIRELIGTINRPSTTVFRYFLCCPVEATSRFLSNISKSLSNIEE